MIYALGVLTGLLIAIVCLLLDARKEKSLVERVGERVEKLRREKGAVIEPISEVEFARQEIIKRNDERGEDTRLEDL